MSQLISVGIIPRTTYDFRELREGTVKVPIAQRIDVSGATALTLELWVYEAQFGAKSSLTLRAANDGYTPENPDSSILQTRNAKGDDISVFVIDSQTELPLYQTISIPGENIARCLALILEATGGPKGGPQVSLSIDLLLRGASEETARGVEPIITDPGTEDAVSGAALARIASASRAAVAARALPRYPRWREIVV
jgi:hypothetical protein